MKKWSEQAWTGAERIYKEILGLPFVRELASGTLSQDRFSYYIAQDSMYIQEYTRVLSHIASRVSDPHLIAEFLSFAKDGVAVEESMHQYYIHKSELHGFTKSPTCMMYTDFLLSQSYQPVEVEIASVLPCFWIYQKVGDYISRNCDRVTNPYRKWISTYDDPVFAMSTRKAIEICDKLAESATKEVWDKMLEAFETASKLEWMFWDSAYSLEKWKI